MSEGSGRPGAFLDRDGTIIEDQHYLADPAGVRLLPGAADGVARLNRAGIPVLLVTNQSGIGRVMFSEADFQAVQDRLVELLAERGARLDGVFHCPHSPDVPPACDCRKPAPGLFLRAASDHGIDLARSLYVGDRLRDVEAGAGWGGAAFVVGRGGAADRPPGVQSASTLADAVQRFLERSSQD